MSSRHQRYRRLDTALRKTCSKIKILSELTWPKSVEDTFLKRHAKELPIPPNVSIRLGKQREDLNAILSALDKTDPIEAFLSRTARSYVTATHMLEATGRDQFTQHSIALYGQPSDRLHPHAPTNLELAQQLLERLANYPVSPVPKTLSATMVADRLRARLDGVFSSSRLPVVIDPNLVSAAAAGARRVRIRGETQYNEAQLDQLFEHEIMIHSATKRNGKAQPILTCLGLSSPRTTATQEGLATIAELMTGVMDIQRLKRIALRIQTIQAALDGANFIEVFQLHKECGNCDTESFRSTARIFRGGDVSGRVVFTKDVVYLRGLILVHSFLRAAVGAKRPDLVAALFCGRVRITDVVTLSQAMNDNTVQPGAVIPNWANNLPCLSAALIWMDFDDRLRISQMTLDDLLSSYQDET